MASRPVVPDNRKQGRARASRGQLGEGRIVAAALAVLAREGLERVGMRSVARELGTAPMSLYRHVAGRAALIELLRRRVMDPPGGDRGAPPAGDPAAWRETLRAQLIGARAQLRRHRGAVALFDSENFRRPVASDAVERALACLAASGLDAGAAARASAALWMYTIGAVLVEETPAVAGWPGGEIAPAQRARWAARTRAAVAGRAPRAAAMTGRWAALAHDDVYAAGLELLLAGLTAGAAAGGDVRTSGRGARAARARSTP